MHQSDRSISSSFFNRSDWHGLVPFPPSSLPLLYTSTPAPSIIWSPQVEVPHTYKYSAARTESISMHSQPHNLDYARGHYGFCFFHHTFQAQQQHFAPERWVVCITIVCLLNAHPRQQPPAAKQDNLVRKTEAQDYLLAALCVRSASFRLTIAS